MASWARVRGEVVAGVGVVVVGHSLWKASEVDSDQILPVHIAKHDPLDTAKAMVGISITLEVQVRVLPRGLP